MFRKTPVMMNIINKNTWPETSFQELFLKGSTGSKYNQQFVGCVLLGCYFGPKFTLERISKFTETHKKEYPDAENIYEFYCGGWITFNLSDAVLLDGTQFHSYKGKMQFGNKLNLGDKDNSWYSWDPQMRELYISRPRQKEREALERKQAIK